MNSITMYILRSHNNMKVMFNHLISGVLIADTVHLLSRILSAYIYDIKCTECSWLWFRPYIVHTIENISLTTSIFITISIAHQRWAITWDPLWHIEISSCQKSRRRRTMFYVLPAIVITVLINIPKLFCYEYDEDSRLEQKTELKTNPHFVVLYEHILCMFLNTFAPITLLILFKWSVYSFVEFNEKDIKGVITGIKLTRASF